MISSKIKNINMGFDKILSISVFGSLSDSDIGDYDYELSLEMKRQKIQRELMKLEQENLEKREEIVIKKDETPTKTRTTAMPKVRNRVLW